MNTTPATLAANAVTIANGRAVTTSLEIARTFHKEHRVVLMRIRRLEIPPEWGMHNFMQTTHRDPQNGQEYPMYYVTRDGFTLLAMGFTGAAAMGFKIAYIEAFNAMEKTLQGQGDATGAAIAVLTATVKELSRRVALLAGEPAARIEAKADTPNREQENAERLKRWRFVTVEDCRRIIRAMDARRKVADITKRKAVATLEKLGCTPEKAQKLAQTINAK
ncbi:MAG: Rha family transcriptional regulator [Oscillospiraceae bacterium]|nr:Rha family transcriptional regulator [Oscillospiraceae bacterium]